MSALIDNEHGPAALLLSIAAFLCLNLLLGIGKFLYEIFRKKAEKSDRELMELSLNLTQNTQAVTELRVVVGVIEQQLKEVARFKSDSQKLFTAIKIIAGPKWPEIRQAIAEDTLTK